jgi:hypothetical protein
MIGLGGLMSAFTPQTAASFANSVNASIDRDIEAQKYALQGKKDNLEASRGLYSKMLEKYKDEDTAKEQTRKAMFSALKSKIEMNAAAAKSPIAKANLLKSAGEIEKEMAKIGADVEKITMEKERYKSERTVSGYDGTTRTPGDATKVSQFVAEADGAIENLKKLEDLSYGAGVKMPKNERNELAKSLVQVIVGQLRVPLTGGGPLQEHEFQRLKEAIGNPTSVFFADNSRAKMRALVDVLKASKDSTAKAYGLKKKEVQGAKEIK